MNSITLFVLLMTPRPECIQNAVKANLTNCRPAPAFLGTDSYFYGVPRESQICDKVPEKDLKPIPKEEFKLSLEYPSVPWTMKDDCYDYLVGKIEAPEAGRSVVTFSTTSLFIGIQTSSSTSSEHTQKTKRKKK